MKGIGGLGRVLNVGAVVVFALGVGLLASSQVSAQDETISMGRVTVAPGAQGTLDLEALNIDPPGLGAWEIDILYDPAVVTPVACSPEAGSLCNPAFTADRVRIIGATAHGHEGDTTLASVTFSCEAVGASGLTLIVNELADATPGDLQPIDAAVEHGSVTCTPPSLPLLGDVNCDRNISSKDATLVLQYDAGLIASLPCPENRDVNGDRHTDSRDATLILQFGAGLITRFG